MGHLPLTERQGGRECVLNSSHHELYFSLIQFDWLLIFSFSFSLIIHLQLRHTSRDPPPQDPPNVYTIYKKAVVMIRSLYSLMRLLPSQRLVRQLKRNKNSSAKITYNLHERVQHAINFGKCNLSFTQLLHPLN